MFFKITLSLLTLLFLVPPGSFDQHCGADQDGCSLIDKTRPAQFIVYEGKSESGIRLRLRNNSSCAIIVETDDTYPTELRRLPNGGAIIESVLDSRDGLNLRLHYLVQTSAAEGPKRAYGWGDSVFTYEIPPGQSIVFDVSADYFKQRSDIAVPFSYSFENNSSILMGIGGAGHRVYLLFKDLASDAPR